MASKNATFDLEASEALLLPFRRMILAFLILCGFMIFAWLVGWLYVFKLYPEDGIPRLEQTLIREMARVNDIHSNYLPVRSISVDTANVVYSAVYGSSGITEMGDRFQRGEYLSESDVRAGRLYAEYYPWLKASMISSQLLGLRLGMLVCVLPATLLFYFIAFSDGIVERAIRRDCGGRESASIYHRAKYLQLTVLCIFTLLYLAWPTPTIYPGAPIAFSVLIGLLARIQWKYYKKYL